VSIDRLSENCEVFILGPLLLIGRSMRRLASHFFLFSLEKKRTRLEVVGFDAKSRLFHWGELIIVVLENGQEVLGRAVSVHLKKVPVLIRPP